MFKAPEAYFVNGILLVHKNWLSELLKNKSVPDVFYIHETFSYDDIKSFLAQGKSPDSSYWYLLHIQQYRRRPNFKVVPLKSCLDDSAVNNMDHDICLSDVLNYVSQYFPPSKNVYIDCTADHDEVLLSILLRIYGFCCPVIQNCYNTLEENNFGDSIAVSNAIAVVVESDHILVLRLQTGTTIRDALDFSPSFFSGEFDENRRLFVFFQILLATRLLHRKRLHIGSIGLNNILIDQSYRVNLLPNVYYNLACNKDYGQDISNSGSNNVFLRGATDMWLAGSVSNLDYILTLNYLVGRTFVNPNHYPLVPWVKNFGSEYGGWRDLSKSKFRLNKGDVQLDLTYTEGAHHISDAFSDITYYVYKARCTQRSVLCRFVRKIWVPGNYPSSIKRLYEWTPDECIPEFYTDPGLFRSIHDDMKDLSLPSWCSSPQEFIDWHRSSLESCRVSERLHRWIDITFGYKMSGSAAFRAKNIHLQLVDQHTQLRNYGIMQLWTCRHPKKRHNGCYQDDDAAAATNNVRDLEMKHDFLQKNELEQLNLSTTATVSDSQTLGCLLLELFLPTEFVAVARLDTSDHLSDQYRYRRAMRILKNNPTSIPLRIYQVVEGLLTSVEKNDFSVTSDTGFPLQISPYQLLLPFSSSTLKFPRYFWTLSRLLEALDDIDQFGIQSENLAASLESIAVYKVKLVASSLVPLLECDDDSVHYMVLPIFKGLLSDSSTSALSAWYLFEPVAKSLRSVRLCNDLLLRDIRRVFEMPHHSLYVRLFHRSFLLSLSVRFGLKVFLNIFVTYLVEAVGGHRCVEFANQKSCSPPLLKVELKSDATENDNFDETDNSSNSETDNSSTHSLSLGNEYELDAEKELEPVLSFPEDGNLTRVASESILWLSNRLGPVLSAKFISRNLLRMLSLCFLYQTSGRELPVLECLTDLAYLYGDQFILLQYFPYAMDLVDSCSRSSPLTNMLEAGLMGCMAMVIHVVPILTDSVLMNELQYNILPNFILPLHQLTIGPNCELKTRNILIQRLCNLVYLIGHRIGEEMARSHFSFFCSEFFSAFDMVYELENGNLSICQTGDFHLPSVLTPELARNAFRGFSLVFGQNYLIGCISNYKLIEFFCFQSNYLTSQLQTPFIREFMTQSPFPVKLTLSGNKISVDQSEDDEEHLTGEQPSRHLRGNWLAYWEHELGRLDTMNYDLKQIGLMLFCGHSSAIKSLYVLDNENSFLSGGRDHTVKVWSLRNCGSGVEVCNPRWSYTGHTQSVHSVAMLEAQNLAISADSVTIQIWDPFVGTNIHRLDSQRLGGGAVVCLRPLACHSSAAALVLTNDSLLHIIDSRLKNYSAMRVKLVNQGTGLVRTICVGGSSCQDVAVGHTSGFISLIDLRTGMLKHCWKAHEGEILTLTPMRLCHNSSHIFLSTSLDQKNCLWNFSDGSALYKNMPSLGLQESVHCVSASGDHAIMGSTSNRLTIYNVKNPLISSFSSSRLKAELCNTNLSCVCALPLNRLILLGQENGSIQLVY